MKPKDRHFNISDFNRLLDSLVVECWHRVLDVQGSIPSQGPRHTKDVTTAQSSFKNKFIESAVIELLRFINIVYNYVLH